MYKKNRVVWCLLLAGMIVFSGCGKKSAGYTAEDNVPASKKERDSVSKSLEEWEKRREEQVDKSIEEADDKNMGEKGTQKKDILIAIDPGHQGWDIDMSDLEANAPGSEVMKAKATEGTSGQYSGIPEFQLNLDVALLVRDRLVDQGYDVIMTRENNETAISNAERASLANDMEADISVRIHANGSEDPGTNGALVLIGSAENPYVGDLYENSRRLGESVLNAYCSRTGMQNLGIQMNDTMTGINWSKIPVIILELGFMTNKQDDLNMADPDYRMKMSDGIVEGINTYYGYENDGNRELSRQLQEILQPIKVNHGFASVYVEELSTEACTSVYSERMQAASLIKLFIAGCVYEQMEEMQLQESYEGETEELIRIMISASDNNAANTLTVRLGHGDATAGRVEVNQFCQVHGYSDTSMGRMMLEFTSTEDNYTSVNDCGRFLKAIYHRELAGSEQILAYMKQQERKNKLPAGLPEHAVTANKTGELSDVENDVAIVYTDQGDYIVCAMMSQLQDPALARSLITELSAIVYQSIIMY